MTSSQTILIIDDDRDIVEAMEAILQMEDYMVHHAYEGKEGIRTAQNIHPHLILLDFMLPDSNGKEVSLAIRADEKLKDIPIILVSAAREAHEIVKELPVNGFIEKPFELTNFLETIRSHLS